MRILLWKLFPPYEVVATKNALKEFLDVHDGLARSRIEEILLGYLKRNPKTVVDSIRLNHKTPHQVALCIVVALLRIQLGSGNFHTYRDRLSMGGENMRSVWSAAVDELVKEGLESPEGAKEARAELAEDIHSAG
ncbi:MAG: hypothetical protein ABL869_02975 [Candidatus Nitrotoga sp.]